MALTNDRIFLRAIMTGDSGMIRQTVQDADDRPGVYCIFNSESNMLYIGCSNNIRTRIVTHKRHMANGEHICKQMSADYIVKPDAFVFFPLEYLDFDDYNSVELHRTVLLNRETQYMKRVPHTRLYNNSIPVSMSEKLLMSDIPADKLKVHVSDIFRRLEMSPDSIRANGYSIQDELTLPDAVEFVRKRTVANGRWPQEKADLAIAYLAELESKTKTDSDSNNDLVAGSQFDYFGDYVVQTPTASPKKNGRTWVLYFLLAAPTVASVHNMFAVTNDLSGNLFDAAALTVVLSVSALGFVWYGIREWHTIALALLLIAYEAFCNLARIYGGLMGIGTTGNPTRFMGLVTDIFGSGTHQTAIVLGGITALFLAAVQYAAIISINKTKTV